MSCEWKEKKKKFLDFMIVPEHYRFD